MKLKPVNQMGRLRHVNCPVWEGNGCQGDFPKFMAGKCVECGVVISNRLAIPTYQKDDGVFYSVDVNGITIELGKEKL